jgi:hypothetical protein
MTPVRGTHADDGQGHRCSNAVLVVVGGPWRDLVIDRSVRLGTAPGIVVLAVEHLCIVRLFDGRLAQIQADGQRSNTPDRSPRVTAITAFAPQGSAFRRIAGISSLEAGERTATGSASTPRLPLFEHKEGDLT